jgi:hypothetical protein
MAWVPKDYGYGVAFSHAINQAKDESDLVHIII